MRGMNQRLRVLCASIAIFAPCVGHMTAARAYVSGSDVSWVTQEESAGYRFRSSTGVETDPFVLLKNLGVAAIRLRVWVNPAESWNDTADVVVKAKRAAAQGQQILVDFHYSDTWADPGHQTEPAAWAGQPLGALETDVANHTKSVLNALKSAGVTVTWVQVGNEINSGMLWPVGNTSNGFAPLAGLINAGYNAVKSVFPSARVIVHLANGYDKADFTWFFGGLAAAGGKWDIVGMSHYPTSSNWSTLNTELLSTANYMISTYHTPVMVVETGMTYSDPTDANNMLADLTSKIWNLGANGLGVFYWEPEAYPGWQGYQMGAVNSVGEFTAAMTHL
jgi:arabinogalactan endo-1,4-beta-galactosidase